MRRHVLGPLNSSVHGSRLDGLEVEYLAGLALVAADGNGWATNHIEPPASSELSLARSLAHKPELLIVRHQGLHSQQSISPQ